MIEFKSDRLKISELEEEFLDSFFEVYTSNTDFLLSREVSRGEAGYYDMDMFQRDWLMAQMTRGRHILGIILENSGTPVGMMNYLEKNPTDNQLWLGLRLIHKDYQRNGLGKEVFTCFANYLRTQEIRTIRAGIQTSSSELIFLNKLGFRSLSKTSETDLRKQIMEYELL